MGVLFLGVTSTDQHELMAKIIVNEIAETLFNNMVLTKLEDNEHDSRTEENTTAWEIV